MGIQWDAAGNPFALFDDFEGTRDLMKEWVLNDSSGQQFAARFNTPASIDKLAEVLQFHNMVISIANLTWVYERLRDSGQLITPEQEAASSQIVEPDVPCGRDGRPLTSSQLEWRNFAIWANDPKTSSRDIAEKRRTSPSFNKFYIESLKREMNETPIDGAVEPTRGEFHPTSARLRL
jgi:hypothetical protein